MEGKAHWPDLLVPADTEDFVGSPVEGMLALNGEMFYNFQISSILINRRKVWIQKKLFWNSNCANEISEWLQHSRETKHNTRRVKL